MLGDATIDEELDLPDLEEGIRFKFKSFKPEDMSNPIFKVGMLFPFVQNLRAAITGHSLKERVEIKMLRNDSRRIRAHCADGFP